MSWIDVRKAYDSVPHDWTLFCLKSYGVHPKIIDFLQSAMKLWSTILTVNNVSLGKFILTVEYSRVIACHHFYLAIMCLAPLSDIVNCTGKGFHISGLSPVVSHLVYMDDLKLYGR